MRYEYLKICMESKIQNRNYSNPIEIARRTRIHTQDGHFINYHVGPVTHPGPPVILRENVHRLFLSSSSDTKQGRRPVFSAPARGSSTTAVEGGTSTMVPFRTQGWLRSGVRQSAAARPWRRRPVCGRACGGGAPVVCGSAEVRRARGEEEAETVVYAAAVAVVWSGGTAVAVELPWRQPWRTRCGL
jgi:hypothetical protein